MSGASSMHHRQVHDPLFAALPAHARGKFLYCSERIFSQQPAGTSSMTGIDLTDARCFDEIVAPFAAAYPGADRRAVISMWSLYYFSTLVIPATVFALVLGMRPPLALDETRIVFDVEKGTPKSFIMSDTPRAGETTGIHDRMRPVMQGHAQVLIDFLQGHARLSPKLLWNNVASYLSWAVEEAGRHVDGSLEAEGRALLDDPRLADGSVNPLSGLLCNVENQGHIHRRRRLCCLRYMLPGVGGCGALCPVPEGRLARERQRAAKAQ